MAKELLFGEDVDSDEPLVELETDKVNVEVPSPLSGTLSSIKVKEGDTVEVGTILGLVKENKSGSVKISREESEDQKTYTPPKVEKKKSTSKDNKVKVLKSNLEKKEDLILL